MAEGWGITSVGKSDLVSDSNTGLGYPKKKLLKNRWDFRSIELKYDITSFIFNQHLKAWKPNKMHTPRLQWTLKE